LQYPVKDVKDNYYHHHHHHHQQQQQQQQQQQDHHHHHHYHTYHSHHHHHHHQHHHFVVTTTVTITKTGSDLQLKGFVMYLKILWLGSTRNFFLQIYNAFQLTLYCPQHSAVIINFLDKCVLGKVGNCVEFNSSTLHLY